MGVVAFKKYTITAGGTPQPLVGTTLSAATVANPGVAVKIAVADASVFDVHMLGTATAYNPGCYATVDVGSVEEMVRVLQINDSTHITVDGLKNAHASGVYIRLNMPINSTYIQTINANAAGIYIGRSPNMVKASFLFCVSILQAVGAGLQPVDFSDGRFNSFNPGNAADWWVDGTTGDGYLPSFGVV